MSKNVKMIVAIVALVVAGGILYFTTFRDSEGSGGGGDLKWWFKCTDSACGAAYSLAPDEFLADNSKSMAGAKQGAKCKKCGQQSVYRAQKCEKCGEVFVMQMSLAPQPDQDYPDRCPSCNYSFIEEMQKN